MSAPSYQDKLTAEAAPVSTPEKGNGEDTRWMILPRIALVLAAYVLGFAMAGHFYGETISGYQQVIRGYQARIAELSQDGATTSSLPVCPPGQFWSSKYNECLENKVNQKPPMPPVNRPPVGAPTGPAENVPPPAPAPNPIPMMPPAPTVDGAPGPDNPGTWIADPDN